MARIIQPVCRMCRREGVKLFLKGEKCYTNCVLEKGKRKAVPGMHVVKRRVKFSEYAKRLREKQKAKRLIGLTEEQFRNVFARAERLKGQTGELLLRQLETRLDNVVRRLGFGVSGPHARQMVLHGHVKVNGHTVTVPSYPLKPGDVIRLRETQHQNLFVQKAMEVVQKRGPLPSWLELKSNQGEGRVRSWPTREEMSFPINEQLIVELYSK